MSELAPILGIDPAPPPPTGDLDMFTREQLEDIRGAVVDTPADLSDWRSAVPPGGPIPGVLQTGDLTLLSAGGGTGKSLLTLWLLALLACGAGGRWLNAYQLPGLPVRCLLVEAECGAARLRRRLRELVLGGALSEDQADHALENLVVYSADRLKDRRLILQSVPALVLLERAAIVCIDPLRVLLPGTAIDENDNVEVGAILDQLVGASARYAFATLVVDHDSKDGRAARGASAKRDAAPFLLHLTRPDQDSPTYLELRLDKGRDPGAPPLVAIDRLEGTPTPDGLRPVSFEATAPRSKESREDEQQSRRAEIVRLVREHFGRLRMGMSIKDLEAQTGVTRRTLQRDLDRLEAVSAIRTTGGGGHGRGAMVLIYPPETVA